MARNIGLFDTSMGIQQVLSDHTANKSMPQARPLASTVMSDVGLEELYLPANAARMVEEALCPDVGDGRLLQPEAFAANLQNVHHLLQDATDPDVRAFVRKDLLPMLDDAALLRTYVGLMING